MTPLDGIRVLDFTSLLPGPLATLVLAEAGAEVTKIERPGMGDEMRTYVPKFGVDAVNFALLNRGKRSVQLDLKGPDASARIRALIQDADVLIEQFRPGVMERLGLGPDAVHAINPGIVYCSISGYGQHGPLVDRAGHDLNYVAEMGLLGLSRGAGGEPVLPPALVADIGGGSYPAVINILLALIDRERTGRGARLDVSMTDNVFTFLYWAMGNGLAAGQWPEPGAELLTGGSPRYNIYRAADGGWIAAAPLEDRFWKAFCDLIDLPPDLRDDGRDPAATIAAVAERLASRTSAEWAEAFARLDVCCSVVRDVREALDDPHHAARQLFSRAVEDGEGATIPALPVPVDPTLRRDDAALGYPLLGGDNSLLEGAPTGNRVAR
jgi:alpha-methylacyl-CoA racemase